MLMNEKDKKICEKYSAYDEDGFVHCNECPLQKGNPKLWDFRCKANSHYDRHLRDWVYDSTEVIELDLGE